MFSLGAIACNEKTFTGDLNNAQNISKGHLTCFQNNQYITSKLVVSTPRCLGANPEVNLKINQQNLAVKSIQYDRVARADESFDILTLDQQLITCISKTKEEVLKAKLETAAEKPQTKKPKKEQVTSSQPENLTNDDMRRLTYSLFCGSEEMVIAAEKEMGEKEDRKNLISRRETILSLLTSESPGNILQEFANADSGVLGVLMVCSALDTMKDQIKTYGCYDLKTNQKIFYKSNKSFDLCSEVIRKANQE